MPGLARARAPRWDWLNSQPVLWTVAIGITLIGAIYFILVQRRQPLHLIAPEGEALAVEAASAPTPT